MNAQIFNMSRFNIGLRKMLIENGKRLALYAIILAAAPILFAVLVPYFSDYSAYSSYQLEYLIGKDDPMWSVMLIWFIFGLFVFGAIAGSLMCSAMSSKEGRTSMLTSPNSMTEKFLIQFLIYIVGFIVIYFCATFIADWLRVLTCKLMAEEPQLVRPMPLSYLVTFGYDFEADEYDRIIVPLTYWSAAVLVSVFALGSSVWPKNSFVKTFAFLLGLQIVITIIEVTAFSIMLPHPFDIRFHPTPGQVCMMINIGSAVMMLGFYALAFRRFTESEIINRW